MLHSDCDGACVAVRDEVNHGWAAVEAGIRADPRVAPSRAVGRGSTAGQASSGTWRWSTGNPPVRFDERDVEMEQGWASEAPADERAGQKIGPALTIAPPLNSTKQVAISC